MDVRALLEKRGPCFAQVPKSVVAYLGHVLGQGDENGKEVKTVSEDKWRR